MMCCIYLSVYADEGKDKYSFEVILDQEVKNPRGLAVAPDGSLWVADESNVIHLDSNGNSIAKFGEEDGIEDEGSQFTPV